MEKVSEQISKEVKYRSEIFNLLKDSLGEMTESELKLIQDLITKDNINEEEFLKRIIE